MSKWFWLAMISCLSLFLELAVIRWLSAEVRLFSYLKNLPLLAAFLGLGIGFALVGKDRDYKRDFPIIFCLFVILVLVIGRISSPKFLAYPAKDELFIWFTAPLSYWLALFLFLFVVLIFFLLTVFLFIPLGQATGEEMAKQKPLPAYIVNIIASLVGIWIFAVVSYLQTTPVVWFGIAIFGLLIYIRKRGELNRLNLSIFGITILVLAFFSQEAIWSPYQRLSVFDLLLPRQSNGELVKVGYRINVQHIFYQNAIDLSERFLESLQDDVSEIKDLAYAYDLPYRLAPKGSRVLIVGSGSGNDVAAALRNGMGHIDAVEIDPAILRIGINLHPERPYDDPRVRMIVDDARSFFEKNTTRYDVVAFGLLDSHTLLSGFSSVRLDSYVYTLESLTQVRNHLDEQGLAVITFDSNTDWLVERIGRMLAEEFGPEQLWVYNGKLGTTFITGNLNSEQINQVGLARWQPDENIKDLPLPTDDWPYLYLRSQKIPTAYWQVLLIIGIVTLALLARTFPEALRPDWRFWFLGAAFLLVEFTSITKLALLFGTTWLVNAFAISGVLIMVLVANVIVLRSQTIRLKIVYVFLFVSLGIVYFFPLEVLNSLLPLPKALASITLLSSPLFFAGIIFSELLRRKGETSQPMASNLNGSFFGGVLEYSALWWGVQSLYITVAFIYIFSLVAYLRHRS
jgi:hypothetical protein